MRLRGHGSISRVSLCFTVLAALGLAPVTAHAAPSAHARPQTALTFTTYTTADGLGANRVESVFAIGSSIFAATRGAGGGLSVSTDAGASFTSRTAADGFTSQLPFDVFGQDNKVYVGTEDGLFISTDGGATFTARTTANGLATNYALDVLAIGNTVYVASSDYPNGGVGMSYNGGTSFMNFYGSGLTSSFIYSVAAVGSDIYAGSFGQGLFHSTNAGGAWTHLTTANGLGGNYIPAVQAVGSTVYVGTNGGLAISTDGGATFTNRTTTDGLGNNNIYDLYVDGSTVYVGTIGGLAISTDGGTSFTNYTTADGLGSNDVFGVYAVGGTVYAATANGLSIANSSPSPSPSPVPPVPASAPADVTASAGDESASVAWAPPVASGSYSISHYLVTARPGGQTCLTTSLTCTVSGLVNGTAYTFTVAALTGAGWSAASDASNAVTPTAKTPPSISIVGSRSGGQISVKGSTSQAAFDGSLTPWTARGGRAPRAGRAVSVDTDGTFSWARKANAHHAWTIYFIGPDGARSNSVTLPRA